MSESHDAARSRRICIVRQGYYPADPRVRREAQALLDGGWEVDVICLRGEGERSRERATGVDVHRLALRHRRASIARYLFEYSVFPMLAAIRLARLHLRRRYDVVQVNTLPDHLVFAAALPKLLGARVVLDMHEAMPELYASKFGPSRRAIRLIEAVERASTRFADRVIVVSEPHRAAITGHGVSADKLTVVMNSPDERIFTRRQEPRARVPGCVLIEHGTLVERYGFDVAIRALGIVLGRLPEARLMIIGDGEHGPALRALAADLGLLDRVEFLGRRPLDEIPWHLARAHIGVVSNEIDAFTDLVVPTKLLEFAAMGVPAVAARTRAVEAYFDESSVQFFAPGDPADLARAVLELAADEARARSLAESAQRAFLASHSWTEMKKVYGELLESAARSA
jgi:glycosyltransferase involved in cell wall biosynthesis